MGANQSSANQTSINIPFEEIFRFYSGIDSNTSVSDCKKNMMELSKKLKINVNSSSYTQMHIKKSEYNEIVDKLIFSINLCKEVDCKIIIDKLSQTKKEVDSIMVDGVNLNLLKYHKREGTFQCILAFLGVSEKDSSESSSSIKYGIYHFSIRDYQLEKFLQDIYAVYLAREICIVQPVLKFCEKYLKDLNTNKKICSCIEII